HDVTKWGRWSERRRPGWPAAPAVDGARGSGPERDLAVDREVEAGLLLAARDAEPEDDAHQLHDHERHAGRVEVRDGDGDGLDAELSNVALDRTRHASDGRDRQDARCQRPERSADTVHREDVERV